MIIAPILTLWACTSSLEVLREQFVVVPQIQNKVVSNTFGCTMVEKKKSA